MAKNISNKLTFIISPRILFDLSEHDSFSNAGNTEQCRNHINNEMCTTLKPGIAFSLIKKLLHINKSADVIRVVLLSSDNADAANCISKSIEELNLDIKLAIYTNGQNPYRYARVLEFHLFLSVNVQDVRDALSEGCAGVVITPSQKAISNGKGGHALRIVFDGDAMLFSAQTAQGKQLSSSSALTTKHQNVDRRLLETPFKKFFSGLCKLQAEFSGTECPIQTVFITTKPTRTYAHIIQTLQSWRVRIDEALFLNGLQKESFLKTLDTDIAFDDPRM